MKANLLFTVLLILSACGRHQIIDRNGNPERNEIIDSYNTFWTDGQLEAIDAHYMSIDRDPDAYGQILMDRDSFEFRVDVYKDYFLTMPYIYEWNPETGEASKRFLTSEQRKWITKPEEVDH